MPFFQEFSCAGCGYSPGRMVHTPYQHPTVCRECRQIVLAEQDPFCPFDDYCCPCCRMCLDPPTEPAKKIADCPKCGEGLACREGFVMSHPAARVREGQRVQFLRIGSQDKRGAGLLRGMPFTLVGELSGQPGLWWGEGQVVGDKQIEVTSRLQDDPRTSIDRFELSDSNSKQPWLCVDFASLRAGLESQAEVYRLPLLVWSNWSSPFGHLQRHTLEPARPNPAEASEVFSAVLTQPSEVHCLAEVYDGREWVPFRQTRWAAKMSSDQMVEAAGGVPLPPGVLDDPGYKRMPFWVDVFHGERRVLRWSQPYGVLFKNRTGPT